VSGITVPAAPARGRAHRLRGAAHLIFGLVLAGVVLWVVSGRRGELEGALSYLSHLKWEWLVGAVATEFLAIVAFGALQRELLAAGRARMSLSVATTIAFAGNAIQNSLPAGPLFSNVWAFRQFRHHGADDVLAVWTLVATSILSAASLAVVAMLGLAFARNTDVGLDVALVAASAVLFLLLVRYLLRRHTWTLAAATRIVRLSQRMVHRPSGDARAMVDSGWQRLTSVAPSRRAWTRAFAYATANWLWDCLALAVSFAAVGAAVPWQGLLLAYGAAQLAINLPITPGGLGVVEGSLTIALVAYGGHEEATVAAVVLYRLISFWGLLGVGWLAWAVLAWAARRAERERDREAVT
jgi:uncharacterized protein (TIRG00374 family)